MARTNSDAISIRGIPISTTPPTQGAVYMYDQSSMSFIPVVLAEGIDDVNGNELLDFITAVSAVNYIEISNAATGSAPGAKATGDDANVSFVIDTKGNSSEIEFKIAGFGNHGYVGISANYNKLTGSYWIAHLAGTAALPTYAFYGDTNTGIFRPAADELGISAGGAEKVNVNADGMGIKTGNHSYYESTESNGNSGTADTIDWKQGNIQTSTLTDNCTFTFTAPTGPCNLQLVLTQDGTGSRTVTRPATVKWSAGVAPVLTTTAGAIDIISFLYDGTNYYGTETLDMQ